MIHTVTYVSESHTYESLRLPSSPLVLLFGVSTTLPWTCVVYGSTTDRPGADTPTHP